MPTLIASEVNLFTGRRSDSRHRETRPQTACYLPWTCPHETGCGRYTRWDCRGRPAISLELRRLIRRMWQANPTWGSPRIVGELQKLGIDIAKSTVEKYWPKLHRPTSPSWRTFLKQHMRITAAIDFFTVPMARLRVLFVLVALAHDRRRVVY